MFLCKVWMKVSLSSADDTILIFKIILEDKCELEAKKQENFEMSTLNCVMNNFAGYRYYCLEFFTLL